MGHCGGSTKHDGLRYYFEEASRLDYGRAKEILNLERAARDVYRNAWKEADSLYKVRRKRDPSCQQWSATKKENFVAIVCYTLEKATCLPTLQPTLPRRSAYEGELEFLSLQKSPVFPNRRVHPVARLSCTRGVSRG